MASTKVKLIKTEAEYDAALERVEQLMDAKPGTDEFAELEVWTTLIEKYENEHHPVDLPDPVEAIKFRMEQQGLIQKDLAAIADHRGYKSPPITNEPAEQLPRLSPFPLGLEDNPRQQR